jgi:predicted alpha/beta-hydrolase family hydrolase
MTSTAQAEVPLPGVRGLVFLGFPLHPPGKPSTSRADHLAQVRVPLLFLQGSRDEFAQLELLTGVCRQLGELATLHLIEAGNHSFKVPKRTNRTAAQVMAELADRIVAWGTPLSADR